MTDVDDGPGTAGVATVPSPALLVPLVSQIPSGWWQRVEAPRGWWFVLHQLHEDLLAIDSGYELRRAARVDNELLYLTFTAVGGVDFAGRIAQAQGAVRQVCETCGGLGRSRTRSRTVRCDLHWHPLSAAEKAALSSADIPHAWFRVGVEIGNEAGVARRGVEARRAASAHLTERDAAELLHVSVRRVREMFEQGRLAGADHDGRVVYPRWQVADDGHLLPGLPAVINAADDLDARTLQAIMENVDAELDGLSPARWLARGRPLEPVLKSLEKWWWT